MRWITFAIEKVLPDPVTPSSVWCARPDSMPSTMRGDSRRLVARRLVWRLQIEWLGSLTFWPELQRKMPSRTLAGFSPRRYSPVTIRLAKRVQRIKPSPTLAVTARAARLKAEGKDIIGLGAGEPDFDTPVHIADAGVAAIRAGHTRYTNVDGTNELKDAIIGKFRRDNGLEYARNQILVSSGAKQTVFNLCCALLDAGDEAIIPAPYWVSYPDMVLVADGTPVAVETGMESGFKITPAQLEAAITRRTRLFILNSPSNPTGAAYSRAELEAFGRVLAKSPGHRHRHGRHVRAHLVGTGAVREFRDRESGPV